MVDAAGVFGVNASAMVELVTGIDSPASIRPELPHAPSAEIVTATTVAAPKRHRFVTVGEGTLTNAKSASAETLFGVAMVGSGRFELPIS